MLTSRWFSRVQSAARLPASPGRMNGRPHYRQVKPCLECLEDRVTPGLYNTVSTILANAATFSLFDQTETVTVHTDVQGTSTTPLDGTLTTPQQQVTIQDGGQTQTVNIDANGNATATFKFNLLQELQFKTYTNHPISSTYTPQGTVTGTTISVSSLLNGNTVNGNAPGNTTGFLFQIFLDAAIVQAFAGG